MTALMAARSQGFGDEQASEQQRAADCTCIHWKITSSAPSLQKRCLPAASLPRFPMCCFKEEKEITKVRAGDSTSVTTSKSQNSGAIQKPFLIHARVKSCVVMAEAPAK